MMQQQSDLLWYVNNEYRKRLTQASKFIDLLEQMVLSTGREAEPTVMGALRYMREQVGVLSEEHRNWRYRFYYDSPESKRMVQDERAVGQALARFNRMRSQHEALLSDLYHIFDQTPRPDPGITRVPSGDMWNMAQYAIHDLLGFGEALERTH